jgi:hypothetical protein
VRISDASRRRHYGRERKKRGDDDPERHMSQFFTVHFLFFTFQFALFLSMRLRQQ